MTFVSSYPRLSLTSLDSDGRRHTFTLLLFVCSSTLCTAASQLANRNKDRCLVSRKKTVSLFFFIGLCVCEGQRHNRLINRRKPPKLRRTKNCGRTRWSPTSSQRTQLLSPLSKTFSCEDSFGAPAVSSSLRKRKIYKKRCLSSFPSRLAAPEESTAPPIPSCTS